MKCLLISICFSRDSKVSNLDNRLWNMGYITPIEMWPRRSSTAGSGKHERVPHERISANRVFFEEIFEVLKEHPVSFREGNESIGASEHAKRTSSAYELLSFESWCSSERPGIMPYITTRDEMDEGAYACWKRMGTGHRVTNKTRFICLMGISYSL